MMIYEARPGVTIDAFALCFKAGKACILKGGREASESNAALAALDTTARVLNDVLAARADPTRVLVAIGLSLAVGIVVVWLGLGLTYLGLLALAAGIAWPLAQFDSTRKDKNRLATRNTACTDLLAHNTSLPFRLDALIEKADRHLFGAFGYDRCCAPINTSVVR